MTANTVSDPVMTDFTLAVLESSGWYKVNYSMTEPFHWGKNEGCEFLDGPCISDKTFVPNFDVFCTPLAQQGCSFTSRNLAFCGNVMPFTTDPKLPKTLNYFNNFTTMADIFADNCPYFIGVPRQDCEEPTAKAFASLPDSEVYGPNSRCFTGTLAPDGYEVVGGQVPYCFPVDVRIKALACLFTNLVVYKS